MEWYETALIVFMWLYGIAKIIVILGEWISGKS
jgi:hypothetical protein